MEGQGGKAIECVRGGEKEDTEGNEEKYMEEKEQMIVPTHKKHSVQSSGHVQFI